MSLRHAVIGLALLFATAATAQVQPVVRVEVAPETVRVGEAAELRLTVLVPTWFSRPPVYPSFELANAITRLPPDSSYPTSERVGSETWSGIVRHYRVYPLVGARFRLAEQKINVSYAQPGSEPVRLDVDVPEIVFRGEVPAGAEGLDPYLAGRRLSVSLQAEGDTAGLQAGDALVLRYAAELDGLPAMFLPPLAPALTFAGVSIYADEPELEDGTPARRSEKLTLVFDTGGEFTVPGIGIPYWNTATNTVETASAAGFTFSVAGPAPATAESEDTGAPGFARIAGIASSAIALLLVLWRAGPRVQQRYRDAARRRRKSEAFAFAALDRALRAGQPRVIYPAMLTWLQRASPGQGARQFATRFGDDALREAIENLVAANYAGRAVPFDISRLRGGLGDARRRCLREASPKAAPALPALNP